MLIVSRDEINDVMHPVVCLVTATERERALPTYVLIDPPEGGVWKPSAILCHAILTIEAWRLAPEPMGTVASGTIAAVAGKLEFVFSSAAEDEALGDGDEDGAPEDAPPGGAARSSD